MDTRHTDSLEEADSGRATNVGDDLGLADVDAVVAAIRQWDKGELVAALTLLATEEGPRRWGHVTLEEQASQEPLS